MITDRTTPHRQFSEFTLQNYLETSGLFAWVWCSRFVVGLTSCPSNTPSDSAAAADLRTTLRVVLSQRISKSEKQTKEKITLIEIKKKMWPVKDSIVEQAAR